jgi:alkylation response protein AidB-like acyl-CoA dehydrogenase
MSAHTVVSDAVGTDPSGDALLAVLDDYAATADATGEPDHAAVALLRTSRLLGRAAPRAYGGTGDDAVTLNRHVARVAAANASAAIMLFQHYAVTRRIAELGTTGQHRALLPELASGRWLAASAWSESGAGANKKNLATTAIRSDGGGWLLDGAKAFTTSAGVADLYLVLARTGPAAGDDPDTGYGAAGQTFFLVRADNLGLVPDLSLCLAGMRGSATGFVGLRGCRVGDGDRLGAEGAAAQAITRVRDSGMTLGAVALGLARAALDAVHRHAERRGLYAQQAFRHRVVTLETQVEAVHAIVEHAGRRESASPGTSTLHSKLFAAETADRVIAQAAEILGSAGYAEAHPLNRYARDVRAVALMGPTNELCRELVSTPWTR